MKWFEGSVKDAVVAAKEKNCFFIVYIEGYGRPSETMTSALNSDEISEALESSCYISLKIKSGSEEYCQFVEVYEHVPIPSLFFIGGNGVPVAIVQNSSDEDEQFVRQQILKIINEHNISLNKCCLSEINNIENNIKLNDISCTNNILKGETDSVKISNDTSERITISESGSLLKEDIESKGSENVKVTFSSSSVCVSNTKIESEEREMEVKDPKFEKKMPLKIQRNKYEENRRILQELKLEKVENEQNRQRILNEIAQDREERLVRQQEINTLRQSVSSENQSSSKSSSNVGENQICIQFRKPDGTTHTAIFHKNSVIDDIRRYVTYNVPLNFRRFDLAIAFPRQVFTTNENNKSLEELNLTTNNVLLILPTSQNSANSTIFRRISNACWYLVSPIFSLSAFVQNTLYRIFPIRQTNNINESPVVQPESSSAPFPLQSQETSSQKSDLRNTNLLNTDNKTNKAVTTIFPVNISNESEKTDVKNADVF